MHTYTVGLNPNKIYQYLAAGRPVVSSYFSELEGRAGAVLFARDSVEFISSVKRVLAETAPEEELKEIAANNDWKVIANRMAELILECLARHGRTAGAGGA
jgi:hypothetical protein